LHNNAHKSEKNENLEDKLNETQKVNFEHLKTIFEGKYSKEELLKLVIENPNLHLGELIDQLCN